jgi:hypothetical protein
LPPLADPFSRNTEITSRDGPPFVAHAMHRNEPAILGEEPQHAGIQLSDVTQFKQSVANRFGQWLPVILPSPQFCKTSDDGREVVWIASLQRVQKLPHWACSCFGLVELYYEVHFYATSNLMYLAQVKIADAFRKAIRHRLTVISDSCDTGATYST